MEQTLMEKWEGRATATIRNATASQAWALLSDFCGFDRWHPGVAECRRVSGVLGVPGCVRYCRGPKRKSGRAPDWANEELLCFDPVARCFSYKMKENSMGFGYFTATFRVLDGTGEESNGGGCMLEWVFECDPVKELNKEQLINRLQAGLRAMAKRVDEVMLHTSRL